MASSFVSATLGVLVLAACSTDTFNPIDGGGDAPSDVTAEACSPAPIACKAGQTCASFDDGTLGPFASITSGTGSVGISPLEFVSCPNSLRCDVMPLSTAQGAAAFADGMLAGTFTMVHSILDLDVWLPTSPTGNVSFAGVYANGDAKGSLVEVAYTNGGWELVGTASGVLVPIRSPLLGAWNHMVLDVTFTATLSTGSMTTATLTYANTMGTTGTTMLTTPTLPTGTTLVTHVTANVGMAGDAITAEMTTYYDNIVFTPTTG